MNNTAVKLFKKLDYPLSHIAVIVIMLFFLMLQYTGKGFRWCFTGKTERGES